MNEVGPGPKSRYPSEELGRIIMNKSTEPKDRRQIELHGCMAVITGKY